MAQHTVKFDAAEDPVIVQTGTLLTEAALEAGVEISQPCGGQGRCGRCMVRVGDGDVRRRSTLRLTIQDVEKGYALACQSVVESDVDEPQRSAQQCGSGEGVARREGALGHLSQNIAQLEVAEDQAQHSQERTGRDDESPAQMLDR